MQALALTTSVPTTSWQYEPDYHIHYKEYTPPALSQIPKGSSIDTLLMSGGHGSFAMHMLNELPQNEIYALCNHLNTVNSIKIKNIVLDSCDSAQFIPQFKSLLDDNGIIYCEVADSSNHFVYSILADYDYYKEMSLGMAMQDVVLKMKEQYQCLPSFISRNYPEVYSKKDNCLYCYGQTSNAVVSHLKQNGINVVEMNSFDQYIDKLKELSQYTVPLCDIKGLIPRVESVDKLLAQVNAGQS